MRSRTTPSVRSREEAQLQVYSVKKKKKYHEVDDSKLKTVESDEKYLYEENAVGLLVFPAGHFSQIVWRESTHLGVGLAQKDGKVSSLSF